MAFVSDQQKMWAPALEQIAQAGEIAVRAEKRVSRKMLLDARTAKARPGARASEALVTLLAFHPMIVARAMPIDTTIAATTSETASGRS